MNKYVNKGEKILFSFLFAITLLCCNVSYSQQICSDTLLFFNAQEKITNSKSGIIHYKLNYVTSEFEVFWDVELYYIKQEDSTKYFYVKQKEDSIISEYVYLNDTLLTIAEYKNEKTFAKRHTTEPFKGNIRHVFTELLDINYLTLFLDYDKVEISDSISTNNQNKIIIGKASSYLEYKNKMDAYYSYEIAINQYNLELIRCFGDVIVYMENDFLHKSSKEFLIEKIELYNYKNQSIEEKIISKYLLLDSIIIQNPQPQTISSLDTIIEIPKYAHDWALPLVGGDTLNSNSINSKIIVLDFYYMSCAPCVLAIRDLVKLDTLFNDTDVSFIGINTIDKDLDRLKQFLVERKINYKNVYGGIDLASKYGFNSFPQILFIDSQTNEIIYHSSGYRSDGYEYYKTLLEKLLENKNL
ncbi:MAG: TlpA family protein disulfide reductase [Bacteroidales bacterium]|nr:TlpA family protein disulfide reductase [Bacteroidales bacterium]